MLPVLLAEVGARGLHGVEEFEHDGEHAVEMSRPLRAFELRAEQIFCHAIAVAVGIKRVRRRREDGVHVRAREFDVSLEGARVTREIGGIVELGRVDEDAEDNAFVLGARAGEQRLVAGVERAHRRHEADRASLPVGGATEIAPFGE